MKTILNPRISPIEDCEVHLRCAQDTQKAIVAKSAERIHYYLDVANWSRVAIGRWAERRDREAIQAGRSCVHTVLEYFYGEWRHRVTAPDGNRGIEAWKPHCLWYEEVQW